MESRWRDEDREVEIYLQLVGLYSWWDYTAGGTLSRIKHNIQVT